MLLERPRRITDLEAVGGTGVELLRKAGAYTIHLVFRGVIAQGKGLWWVMATIMAGPIFIQNADSFDDEGQDIARHELNLCGSTLSMGYRAEVQTEAIFSESGASIDFDIHLRIEIGRSDGNDDLTSSVNHLDSARVDQIIFSRPLDLDNPEFAGRDGSRSLMPSRHT